jgi:hypothetical protein
MINTDAPIGIQAGSYERADTRPDRSWWPESALSAEELRASLGERRYFIVATTNRESPAVARPVVRTPPTPPFSHTANRAGK